MSTSTGTAAEQELLERAREQDENAFGRLVEPYRGELHAHCYRMLGSVYDGEDALQEALLRAWRAIGRFEGRSSLRSWLYTIATNTCLNHIARRPKRVLPIDYGPATDPHDGPGTPLVETVWVEPYPDEQLGLEDGLAGPRRATRCARASSWRSSSRSRRCRRRSARSSSCARSSGSPRRRWPRRSTPRSRRSTARSSGRGRPSRSASPSRASRRRCDPSA